MGKNKTIKKEKKQKEPRVVLSLRLSSAKELYFFLDINLNNLQRDIIAHGGTLKPEFKVIRDISERILKSYGKEEAKLYVKDVFKERVEQK